MSVTVQYDPDIIIGDNPMKSCEKMDSLGKLVVFSYLYLTLLFFRQMTNDFWISQQPIENMKKRPVAVSISFHSWLLAAVWLTLTNQPTATTKKAPIF